MNTLSAMLPPLLGRDETLYRNEVVRALLQMACITAHDFQHFGTRTRLSFGGGGPDLRSVLRKALSSVLDPGGPAVSQNTPEMDFSDYSDGVMLVTLLYAAEPVTYAVNKDTGIVNLWALPKL